MREEGESKISLCYESFPQSFCERGRVIKCVWSVWKGLRQWWLAFNLSEVDATLGDG